MAFERAKIEIKPASVGTGIKVSIAKIRNGTAKMRLSVLASAAKKLGWANGDKLEVLLGTGEHHGLMRLRKNNSAGDAECIMKKGVHDHAYMAIALGHQPMFVERPEPARWCQFEEVEDGWIELVLPKWADETGPSKKRAEALPSTVTTQPARPARNVTASVMGDPPPGRRQMLDKIGAIA